MEKFFDQFPKTLPYDVIVTPQKMRPFGTFSLKMTYFDQIDPIIAISDQIYGNKPDWNNFSNI